MKNFSISYDDKEDILYLARDGEEEEVIEISPGVNIELDSSGELIGVELFNASALFRDVLDPMAKRMKVA